MDKIILKGLEFHGRHGCFPEEKKYSQQFKVDGELFLDLENAINTDDLQATVNYGDIFELVRNQVENKSYNLIEKLSAEIIKEIFNYSPLIKEIQIRLIKPTPPVEGKYEYFAVEMRRKREWLKPI